MIALGRPERLTHAAILAIAVAASCAEAENSPLADPGGDDEGSGKGGSAGSGMTGGSAGSTSSGGTAGKGGATTGGSTGKGGSTSTGGKGGSSTGGSSTGGSTTTTYGCKSDGEGGAGGEGGASGGAPAGGAGGAGPETLFVDDFEDGDADGWASTSGEWDIVDDDSSAYEQSQFDGNTLRVASVADACWDDQIVEARVKVLDFGGQSTSYSANVFARYVNASTYYVLGMNSGSNGTLFIGKAANGSLQRLATEGGFGFGEEDNEDTWFTLRLEIVGSNLKAYLNGTLELEASDAQITSGGVAVGTTHASARFDDVKVTSP